MPPRKPFLLRVEPALLAALERWAADDLRSVNGQIEFVLREALRRAGRKVAPVEEVAPSPPASEADADAPVAPPTTDDATPASDSAAAAPRTARRR